MRCSNPKCRKLTTGPRTDSTRIVNVGVGAHITGASEGGPRFDPCLSSEDRKSPDNGIWLCQSCAKLIDNDPTRYTVDLLRSWKTQAEASALAALEGVPSSEPTKENLAELDITYEKVSITQKRHDYRLVVSLVNRGEALLGPYHADIDMPARVIERPESIHGYVSDRSTHQWNLFRVSRHNQSDDVYPGDTKVIITIPYYMDNDIYRGKGDLFERLVTATLYRQGYPPLVIEVPFRELQKF